MVADLVLLVSSIRAVNKPNTAQLFVLWPDSRREVDEAIISSFANDTYRLI
jgi:hypothetical protein